VPAGTGILVKNTREKVRLAEEGGTKEGGESLEGEIDTGQKPWHAAGSRFGYWFGEFHTKKRTYEGPSISNRGWGVEVSKTRSHRGSGTKPVLEEREKKWGLLYRLRMSR